MRLIAGTQIFPNPGRKLAIGVLVLGVAVLWLFFGPLGRQPVPDSQEEFHALAVDLIEAAEKSGRGYSENPDFLHLTGEILPEANLLADALVRLADVNGDPDAQIRRAFAALGRGDARPAANILAPIAAGMQAAAEASESESDRRLAFDIASVGYADYGALLRLYDRNSALAAFRNSARLAVDPVEGWLRFGHIAVHLRALDSASFGYEQVLDRIDPFEDWEATAMALGGLGFVSLTRGDIDRAIAFQHEAVRMTEMLGQGPRIAAVYGQLGVIQLAARDFEMAAVSLAKALRIEQELGRTDGVAWVREKLALLENAGQ